MSLRHWKPIFIVSESIIKALSVIAPIDIGAITLGFLVISRQEPDEETKTHEIIHFQQFLETFFIGFLFIYLYDYLKNKYNGMEGEEAYMNIRAELEAHENDKDPAYLYKRKRYAWLRPRKKEDIQNA